MYLSVHPFCMPIPFNSLFYIESKIQIFFHTNTSKSLHAAKIDELADS